MATILKEPPRRAPQCSTLEECDAQILEGFVLIEDVVLAYARLGLNGSQIAQRIRGLGVQIGDTTVRSWIRAARTYGNLPEKQVAPRTERHRRQQERQNGKNCRIATEPEPSVGRWSQLAAPAPSISNPFTLNGSRDYVEEAVWSSCQEYADALVNTRAMVHTLRSITLQVLDRHGPDGLERMRQSTSNRITTSGVVSRDQELLEEIKGMVEFCQLITDPEAANDQEAINA